MPNRLIKESICTSDNLNTLTAEEERFFYRLTVNCDDYGITDARLPILRSKCFPLKIDEIKEKDIEKWLKALIRAKLVFTYVVDNRPYLKMTSWEKHQQIRAKKSKFPLPDSNGVQLISDDIECEQGDSNENQLISDDDICPRNPIQSNPNTNPNLNTNICVSDIEKLWEMYPKKKGKSTAFKKIPKLIGQYGLEQLIRCVERYVTEIKEKNTQEQYIKQGDTFFNGGFEDYLDSNYKGDDSKNGQHKENTGSGIDDDIIARLSI